MADDSLTHTEEDWEIPSTIDDRPAREAWLLEPWTPSGFRLLSEDEVRFIDDNDLPAPYHAVVYIGNLWHKCGTGSQNWGPGIFYYAVPEETPVFDGSPEDRLNPQPSGSRMVD